MPPLAVAWHGHALVTLVFWLPVFVVGSVYNAGRWCQRSPGAECPHPPLRALTEGLLPLVLLGCAAVGWWTRRLPLYLVGSLPVVVLALCWCWNAEACQRGSIVPTVVFVVLHLQLTACLVLGVGGSG